VVASARAAFGHVDLLIVNHARSEGVGANQMMLRDWSSGSATTRGWITGQVIGSEGGFRR
jgi:hypothetical protein